LRGAVKRDTRQVPAQRVCLSQSVGVLSDFYHHRAGRPQSRQGA
jgi:hypothetical protein